MNYFEFFEIPISFYPDKGLVRSKYIQNSKKLHPDIYQGEDEDEAMVLTALNNKAYTTLNSLEKTISYILEELYPFEGKQILPPSFLGEMMETNEALMEAKMMDEEEEIEKIKEDVSAIKNRLFSEMEVLMKSFKLGEGDLLEKVRILNLKQNYLKRLLDKL